MPTLTFLLDENLPGRFHRAIQRHNALMQFPIDCLRVGGATDVPFGVSDEVLIKWAESAGRIIVSEDRRTLPSHLEMHLASGRHTPGILLIRPNATIPVVLEYLVMVAYVSESEEWRDRVVFIP